MTDIRIFLASSSELADDRLQFERLIGQRNKIWRHRGVFLEVLMWEDFIDAMSATRLQDEYNRAIRECHIFVLLAFTKVGKYTEEEFAVAFKQFQENQRPFVYTYFKDAEIRTGSAAKDDLMSLWSFQQRLKALGHYQTPYRNVEALQLHFLQQLDKLADRGLIALQQADAPAGPTSDRAPTAPPGAWRTGAKLRGYLKWLQARTGRIELRGIERAGGAAVVVLPLETAYVSLRARPLPRLGQRPPASPPLRTGDGPECPADSTDIALQDLLALGPRLVIVGGPGCGKSTVLLHMAWALATSLLEGSAEPARSRLGLVGPPETLPLPIFVPLASFARYRRQLSPQAPARERTLAHFIAHHLVGNQGDFELPAEFFMQLLDDTGGVLLLLDGLDEVANENERADVRQSVEDLVSGRDGLRVVLTCRTVAYRSGRTAVGADFREIAVQPLDPVLHIAPMVRQAYACIYPHDEALRAERIDDLLGGIAQLEGERRRRLGADAQLLVDSPLMVRLLLIVHVNNRRLPDERADLFDKAVGALLQVDYGREEGDIRELSTDWKLFREMAQQLAFEMHRQGPDQGRDIEEQALVAVLSQDAEFAPRVADLISHARQRGSVIEEREGSFRFIHLAFQEYLVARYVREVLGAEGREAILSALRERLDDPWWREPILLTAGYWAVRAAKPARDFIASLGTDGTTPAARLSAAELAGTAALEWRESGLTLRELCGRRLAQLLADPEILGTCTPVARARAGDALALLGDPRFDERRLHLPADGGLGFVAIAADAAFCLGTRRADVKRVAKIIDSSVGGDEINDNPTPTTAFYIARYPVTVAQFRNFVQACKPPGIDPEALRDPDSRPVRQVSWHDAMAYARWLGERLAASRDFADEPVARLIRDEGWRLALPTELEWEKAARGGLNACVFSWGDAPDPQAANYQDGGIADTSVVGCFAPNAYGLYDMLGNTWEWTSSVWSESPWERGADADGRPPEGAEGVAADVRRVVRGGSWYDRRDLVRCACRGGDLPDYRGQYLGFRLALRPSAASADAAESA